MVTLATAVNTTATTWALSAALPAGTEYIQVDDELVAVITPAIRPNQREDPTLFAEVERGTAGTVASHSQGATLTVLANPPLGSSAGTIYSASVALTDAQIKALPSTPVEIIPAPGAGSTILPIVCTLRMEWVADYTNISANAEVRFRVGASGLMHSLRQDTLSGVGALLAGGGPDGTWATFMPRMPITGAIADPATNPHFHGDSADSGWYDSDVENIPLTLDAQNTGAFTGGNAGNSLTATVIYTVIEF